MPEGPVTGRATLRVACPSCRFSDGACAHSRVVVRCHPETQRTVKYGEVYLNGPADARSAPLGTVICRLLRLWFPDY